MSGLRLGELCAGYGGLGMAVEEVFGATSAWFSEFDDAPSKILAHHWPDVPNYGDMTKIDWAAIEPVDIISGGTPCQDLSAAGRRAGMTEGTRSNLWVQMREAIAIQKPTYVVWENVRGAYSATAASDLEQCPGCMGDTGDGGTVLRALGRVLGDLSDLGYDTQWRGLRAADVGACHGRFRVFVLAQDTDLATRSERRQSAPGQAQRGRTWTDAGRRDRALTADSNRQGLEVGRNAGVIPGPGGNDSAAPFGDQEPTPDASSGGQHGRADLQGEGRREGIGSQALNHPRNGGASRLDAAADTTSTRRAEGEDGGTGCCYACKRPWSVEPERASGERVGEATPIAPGVGGREGWAEYARLEGGSDAVERSASTNWGDYAPAIRRWEAVMGRRAPAPTDPTGRNGGHRLSPRFTEWMMGLPDGWVTDPAIGISRNEQLKACGNGVVPQQAMAALRDMLAAFQAAEVAA